MSTRSRLYGLVAVAGLLMLGLAIYAPAQAPPVGSPAATKPRATSQSSTDSKVVVTRTGNGEGEQAPAWLAALVAASEAETEDVDEAAFAEPLLCALAQAVEAIEGDLTLVSGPTFHGRGRAIAAGDELSLLVPAGHIFVDGGQGVLQLPGYLPMELGWQRDESGAVACFPSPVTLEAGTATLSGRVAPMPETEGVRVFVVGCTSAATVDEDGGYFMEVAPGPCELRAGRQEGPFTVWGPWVEADPEANLERIVDLDLPEGRAGGLGVGYDATDEGVRIERVLENSAAADAGLAVGDLVVEIDGVDARGMDRAEFVERSRGLEGTTVTLRVISEQGERSVELVRKAFR